MNFSYAGKVSELGLDGKPVTVPRELPWTCTQSPVTTSGSVLGLCFDGGIMLAADTLASYGSLKRYRDCRRVMRVNDGLALAAAGDFADFQYLKDIIEAKMVEDRQYEDGFNIKPKAMLSYLTRILYNSRSRFDPFWNTFVIAGFEDGKPFIGVVDKIGTSYSDTAVATSMGTHLALPLLRDRVDKNPKMTEKQAREAITDAMRILFYRDRTAFHKYDIATITPEGVKIEGPLEMTSNWEIAHMISGY